MLKYESVKKKNKTAFRTASLGDFDGQINRLSKVNLDLPEQKLENVLKEKRIFRYLGFL